MKRTMQLVGAQRPLVEVRWFESLALLGEGSILAMVGPHRVTMRMVVVVVVVPSAHCTYCGGGWPTSASHTSHPVTMVEPTISAMLVSTHSIAIQHVNNYVYSFKMQYDLPPCWRVWQRQAETGKVYIHMAPSTTNLPYQTLKYFVFCYWEIYYIYI